MKLFLTATVAAVTLVGAASPVMAYRYWHHHHYWHHRAGRWHDHHRVCRWW
jgi:hypothetical protein